MTPFGRSECRAHRQTLLALLYPDVADAARGLPADPAALAHLESCKRCRVAVERQRLLAYRLWRDVSAAKGLEPSHEAWPALQRRIARRPAATPRAARPGLGGILGAGLAAALLIAVAAPARLATVDEPGFDPRSVAEQGRRDAADEARWQRSNAHVRVPARSEAASPGHRASMLARYGETVERSTGHTVVIPLPGGYRAQ